MIKILLVDDEILVLQGLKTMIEWERYGFTIVGQATDGKKALELAERFQPDIVLTDLVMPQMDGLELIHQLKECLPQTRVVVLSCHNDYSLVREAMQLFGALDFLFKLTMQPQDILDTLLKVKKIIEHDQEQERLQQEYRQVLLKNKMLIFSRYVQQAMRQEWSAEMLFSVKDDPKVFDFDSAPYVIAAFMAQDGQTLSVREEEWLYQALEKAACECGLDTGVFSVLQYEYCLIARQPSALGGEAWEDTLERLCRNIANDAGQRGLKVFYGRSGAVCGICSLRPSYADAHTAAYGQADAYAAGFLGGDIEKVLAYLREHFADSIRLPELARYVHMNESYLSSSIKKKTGYGFTEILNRIRVSEAKKQLADSGVSTAKVAEQVGFASWSYFSRVFKKYTGLSPSEYQRRSAENSAITQK